MLRITRTLLLVAGLLLLAGCGDATLRDSLTQDQANEVVAELVERGIPAAVERESGGRGKYSVLVKRGSYSEAVSVLYELKLPSEPRTTFAELIAPRGLMPDSREVEALRLDRALAAEIEEALQTNPAVASARVVVRMNSVPPDASLGGAQKGAAAIVRLRPEGTVSAEDLKSLISQSLPGIDPAQIRIEVHNAVAARAVAGAPEGVERHGGEVRRVPLTEFLWAWRVPEDQYNSLAGGLLAGILAVFLLGVGLGSVVMSARLSNKDNDLSSVQRRLPPGRSERTKKELPEIPKDGPTGGQ